VTSAHPAGSLDPANEARVRDSFGRQTMLATLGAVMTEVDTGRVVLEMPDDARFRQQFGYVHAGAVTTLVDTACGYAALPAA
jgi:acyl-coenzyme A thioesterase PaaI-like protein